MAGAQSTFNPGSASVPGTNATTPNATNATNPRIDRLNAELEAALLRELSQTWHDLNAMYFKDALRPPEIRLSDAGSRLGQFDPRLRTIEIGRSVVLDHSWGVVIEVLKHEMAHQYVNECIGCTDDSSHGPHFQNVCARLGIDPRASGLPSASSCDAATDGRDMRVLQRVVGLLALAQSANIHEAQVAAATAQKLMLKYNIELATGDARRAYAFRQLGTPKGRISESERLLSTILGEHFFVEVIWVPVYRPLEKKRGQVLEICGTPENLEMASYVHGFLTAAAEHLWRQHKRDMGIRSNRERQTYLAGVMEGFREKLVREGEHHREQGLVWVGDPDLHGYYRKRHPRIRHIRSVGERRTAARGHGRAAGRNLVLHRGVTSGSTGGASPKLLGR